MCCPLFVAPCVTRKRLEEPYIDVEFKVIEEEENYVEIACSDQGSDPSRDSG